jgi:hypothetical protein
VIGQKVESVPCQGAVNQNPRPRESKQLDSELRELDLKKRRNRKEGSSDWNNQNTSCEGLCAYATSDGATCVWAFNRLRLRMGGKRDTRGTEDGIVWETGYMDQPVRDSERVMVPECKQDWLDCSGVSAQSDGG